LLNVNRVQVPVAFVTLVFGIGKPMNAVGTGDAVGVNPTSGVWEGAATTLVAVRFNTVVGV
jgi:fumarylacetoacetate (FAA) hydrolase family protein